MGEDEKLEEYIKEMVERAKNYREGILRARKEDSQAEGVAEFLGLPVEIVKRGVLAKRWKRFNVKKAVRRYLEETIPPPLHHLIPRILEEVYKKKG